MRAKLAEHILTATVPFFGIWSKVPLIGRPLVGWALRVEPEPEIQLPEHGLSDAGVRRVILFLASIWGAFGIVVLLLNRLFS